MQTSKSQPSHVSIPELVLSVMKQRFHISVDNDHPCFDAIVTSILNIDTKAQRVIENSKEHDITDNEKSNVSESTNQE